MLECKRCHLTGVPDHHFNYRVCPFCESYFLCLTLAQEHYLKCDQRKSHIEKSVEKKIRIEDEDQQQQGGSRGNLEEERVSFEPFQKQRTRKCFKELQRYEFFFFPLQVYLPFSIADTLTINTSLIHLIYIDLCLKQKIFLKITYWNILKSTGSLNSVGHSVHDGDEKTARLLCTSFVPSKYLFIYSFIYFSFIYLPRTRTFLHPGDFLELWESDHVDIQKQFDEFLDNGYFYSFQDIYLSSFP